MIHFTMCIPETSDGIEDPNDPMKAPQTDTPWKVNATLSHS